MKKKYLGFLTIPFYFLIGIVAVSYIMIFNLNKVIGPSDENFAIDQVKNNLATGLKECLVREIESETTTFKEVRSFSEKHSWSKFFEIKPIDPDSCFKAQALSKSNKNTWFKIELDQTAGEFLKTCGDSNKPGCEEGNTW